MWIIVTAVSRTTFPIRGSQPSGRSQGPARATSRYGRLGMTRPKGEKGRLRTFPEGLGPRE
jgi:hypothetical protein